VSGIRLLASRQAGLTILLFDYLPAVALAEAGFNKPQKAGKFFENMGLYENLPVFKASYDFRCSGFGAVQKNDLTAKGAGFSKWAQCVFVCIETLCDHCGSYAAMAVRWWIARRNDSRFSPDVPSVYVSRILQHINLSFSTRRERDYPPGEIIHLHQRLRDVRRITNQSPQPASCNIKPVSQLHKSLLHPALTTQKSQAYFS